MLLNDRDEYPMVFETHVDFSGAIDRDAFEWAVEQTCRRQTFFHSKVVGRAFGSASWVRCPEWTPSIHWVSQIDEAEFQPPQEDRLRSVPCFRTWVANKSDSSHVVFQFHHAVVDGLGALEFIGEVLQHYHDYLTKHGEPIPLPAYDQLPQRANVTKRPRVPVSAMNRLRSFVREAFIVLRQRPKPLIAPSADQEKLNYGELLTFELNREEFASYRRQATHQQVSVNDYLMMQLFATLADWQKKHGAGSQDNSWLRVTMPVSHHHRVPRTLPSCNRINFAFLTRQISAIANRSALLAGIAKETQLIREFELADHFAATLQMAGRIPGLMRRFTSEKKCFSTAIFSNMGDIVRHSRVRIPREDGRVVAGGLRMERLIAAPPLQANTRLAVCALVYAGSLYLTFRFDGRYFSRAAGAEFIANIRRNMEEAANSPKK